MRCSASILYRSKINQERRHATGTNNILRPHEEEPLIDMLCTGFKISQITTCNKKTLNSPSTTQQCLNLSMGWWVADFVLCMGMRPMLKWGSRMRLKILASCRSHPQTTYPLLSIIGFRYDVQQSVWWKMNAQKMFASGWLKFELGRRNEKLGILEGCVLSRDVECDSEVYLDLHILLMLSAKEIQRT